MDRSGDAVAQRIRAGVFPAFQPWPFLWKAQFRNFIRDYSENPATLESMTDSLSDDAILGLLKTEEDRLPGSVIEEAVRRGVRLESALTRWIDDPALWDAPPPDCWAPLHATFVLARMGAGTSEAVLRGIRAANACRADELIDYAGDLLAVGGPPALERLRGLAGEPKETPELRGQALEALARIGLAHPGVRDEVGDFLRRTAEAAREPELVRMTAAAAYLEFARPEDRDLLRRWIKEDLLGEEPVRLALSGSLPPYFGRAPDWMEFYSPQAIEERYHPGEELEDPDSQEILDPDEIVKPDPALEVLSRLDEPALPGLPHVNLTRKIGRNDPCTCGSGLKYKK